MNSVGKRQCAPGRWIPITFYGLIVLGWLGEGIAAQSFDLLWLVIWTFPAPALYIWRLRWTSQ